MSVAVGLLYTLVGNSGRWVLEHPVHTSGYAPVHPSGYAPVHPSGYAPVHPSGYAPVHPSGYAPVHPSGYATGWHAVMVHFKVVHSIADLSTWRKTKWCEWMIFASSCPPLSLKLYIVNFWPRGALNYH